MLTDYSHYHFHFDSQFVDVLARGFWFEKSPENLFAKELPPGHPLRCLQEIKIRHFEMQDLKYKVVDNPLPEEEIVNNTAFCPQTLYEIHSECDGKYRLNFSIKLLRRNGKLVTVVPFFSNDIPAPEGIFPFEKIQVQFEERLPGIVERTKHINKNCKFFCNALSGR